MAFFKQHCKYVHPVYFRAAIFCRVLGEWCLKYNLWISVYVFQDGKVPGEVRHPKFWIWLKLTYQSIQPNRMLEVMYATNFIIGAHHTMINEFGPKCIFLIQWFLKEQRERNLQLVANDKELWLAVERFEIKDRKHEPSKERKINQVTTSRGNRP